MEEAAKAVSARITQDRLSGSIYYTISQEITISCTKLSSQHRPIPELLNFQLDPNGRLLPLKNPELQVYFRKMEEYLCTCHPAALRAEAVNLTQEILTVPTNDTPSIRSAAKILAKAGCRTVKYSRSCALIAHAIFCQLQSTSYDASILFGDSLICAVMEVFDGHYFEARLWRFGGLNGLSKVEEMVGVAAFTGDLFALGLLPIQMVHDRIIRDLACPEVMSTVHCRALHLFLLHARVHIGPSIGLDVLGDVRRQLVEYTWSAPMGCDDVPRLWLIECCTVIDRTTKQEHEGGGTPGVVLYQWDAILSEDGWFSTLIS